jgi:hypothetical protein
MKKSKIEQIIHQDIILKQALSDPRVTRRDFSGLYGSDGHDRHNGRSALVEQGISRHA